MALCLPKAAPRTLLGPLIFLGRSALLPGAEAVPAGEDVAEPIKALVEADWIARRRRGKRTSRWN